MWYDEILSLDVKPKEKVELFASKLRSDGMPITELAKHHAKSRAKLIPIITELADQESGGVQKIYEGVESASKGMNFVLSSASILQLD